MSKRGATIVVLYAVWISVGLALGRFLPGSLWLGIAWGVVTGYLVLWSIPGEVSG